jgi:hypothetical protein
MNKIVRVAVMLAFLLPAAHAHAAMTAWVGWAGQDANNHVCDRGSPCITFQHAHDVVDAGGTINCIEPSHYGFVTITKSVTIDCTGTLARSSGIVVNAPGPSVVTLRGISLDGEGTRAVGIEFLNGGALHVESCHISGYRNSTAGIGAGIRFVPPAGVTAKLHVSDSVIGNNGLPATSFVTSLGSAGIIIAPAPSGAARVVVDRTRVENNTNGILAGGTAATGAIVVQVRDSVAANNDFNGISALAGGSAPISVVVERSAATLNGNAGIFAQGAPAVVRLGQSSVSVNAIGFDAILGGHILSYQDNELTANVADGATAGALTPK